MENRKSSLSAHAVAMGIACSLVISTPLFAAEKDASFGAGLLPANARAGECYAKVMVPAVYKTINEKVVIAEASEKIEIIPAKYEQSEVRVPVMQEAEKLVAVPATFETVKEKIEIEPAHTVWKLGPGKNARNVSDRDLAIAIATGLPKTVKGGQCFNEFLKPAKFESKAEKILKTAASEKITTTKPQYKWVEDKVLIKEASEKIVEVPAKYETITEKVLESPAYTTWKKGRGLNEQVDNATGEIMCLVEIPAKYTTLKKRVLKTSATVKKISIPAEYKTVRVQKLLKPASESRATVEAEYQTVTKRAKVSDARVSWSQAGVSSEGKATGRTYCMASIPAKYKTITKRVIKDKASVKKVEVPARFKSFSMSKLVSAPSEKRIPIPAKHKLVKKHSKVSAASQQWRPVLCETNTTPELVTQIQLGLQKAGFKPGTADGVLGHATMSAADAYQRKHNLPTGGLTILTIQKLGISIGG